MNESPDVNTKKALLAAAIKVFADKGFDSATVRAICSMAKANVAAVNYHFGSKNGLYSAVLQKIFPNGEEWKANIASSTPEEELREFLRGLAFDIYERDNGLVAERWAIFLREMAKPSENLDYIVHHQVQPRANTLRTILIKILGPYASDTTLAYCGSNIWAMMLDHLLTQPILDRMTPHRPQVQDSIDEWVDHIVTFSLGGLMATKNKS
ncbi:TetR/AcrR family transcriptional regulator [Pseudodesulfovibrio sediminis]|uniref:TetR family transcriptional regulator n=1 Tax=Pseudodesulfovibrio sediminis TaxID=2810563 RepID=A0ABM7P9P2_9BACT|nr:CerR family C-terminal domain-containing protein [Pseudodesulfovibrio sediminis]BCS89700.1 TetR family transcriptional regulator [Pseudodesulfovibrio sediminis]